MFFCGATILLLATIPAMLCFGLLARLGAILLATALMDIFDSNHLEGVSVVRDGRLASEFGSLILKSGLSR